MTMQKDELTLTPQKVEMNPLAWLSLTRLTLFLAQMPLMKSLAELYGWLLNEKVSALQAVYFFYAQLTALLVLLPVAMPYGWRACFLLLFCLAAGKTRGR